jgi:hypothetical protein
VEEVAEKSLPRRKVGSQRLKARSKQSLYRSGEPLRHPKTSTTANFCATTGTNALPVCSACEAAPFQNKFKLNHHGESAAVVRLTRYAVSKIGAPAVTTRVCSKWAESEWSLVRTVQPSFSVNTLPDPLEMIGSTVITKPAVMICAAWGSA